MPFYSRQFTGIIFIFAMDALKGIYSQFKLLLIVVMKARSTIIRTHRTLQYCTGTHTIFTTFSYKVSRYKDMTMSMWFMTAFAGLAGALLFVFNTEYKRLKVASVVVEFPTLTPFRLRRKTLELRLSTMASRPRAPK